MARSLIEERYTWPVRTVLLGGGSLWATSYQIREPLKAAKWIANAIPRFWGHLKAAGQLHSFS
jgi:hypothetical protein